MLNIISVHKCILQKSYLQTSDITRAYRSKHPGKSVKLLQASPQPIAFSIQCGVMSGHPTASDIPDRKVLKVV